MADFQSPVTWRQMPPAGASTEISGIQPGDVKDKPPAISSTMGPPDKWVSFVGNTFSDGAWINTGDIYQYNSE